jgi:hypothetical protein
MKGKDEFMPSQKRLAKNLKKVVFNCLPHWFYANGENFYGKIVKLIKKDRNYTENFTIEVSEGDNCVILGNGPSLKDSLAGSSYEFIKNNKKICVNDAMLYDGFSDLKPEILVFMDPVYWAKVLVEPVCSNIKKCAAIMLNIDWHVKMFLPLEAKKWNHFIELPSKNKNIEIIYVNIDVSPKSDEELRFLDYKENKAMPLVQNVLVACIYIAINAGFKNIYLFGADHSWHETLYVSDDNIPSIIDKHFFDKEEQVTYIPIYQDSEGKIPFTMAKLFGAYSRMYMSYEELANYAKFMGSKVYNASEKSYIDAFERIKL